MLPGGDAKLLHSAKELIVTKMEKPAHRTYLSSIWRVRDALLEGARFGEFGWVEG